jgi:hypothetical protein
MNATSIYARVSLIAAAIVGAGSFLGSAFKLVQIGLDADMGAAAYTVPVSLDLVAMTAALVRLTNPASLGARLFARLCLFIPTAISCSVQVAAVPESGSPLTTLIHRVVAGAPSIAAAVVFELALIAGEAGCAAVTAPTVETTDEGASAAPPPPLPVAATGNAPARPRRSHLELLPIAERVAAELAAEGATLSRRALQCAMEAAGHPVRSNGTADRLLAHLRATWNVEGVAA